MRAPFAAEIAGWSRSMFAAPREAAGFPTGKTLFFALVQHVVEQRLKVAWSRFEGFGALIRAHRIDDTITRTVDRLLHQTRLAQALDTDTGVAPMT